MWFLTPHQSAHLGLVLIINQASHSYGHDGLICGSWWAIMTWVRWFSFRKRTPRHLITTHAPCCKIMDTSIEYLGKAECRGSLGSSLGGEKIIFVMVYVHMLCLHMMNAWCMCMKCAYTRWMNDRTCDGSLYGHESMWMINVDEIYTIFARVKG